MVQIKKGNKMQLKPNTEKALDGWLKIETWHTGRGYDMERFFVFVNEYQKEHGYTIDEPGMRDVIKEKLGIEGELKEPSREIIDRYISLAYNILDFLKHTGR